MREELRKLREDRESHITQLSAVEKQPTQRGEQQRSEETPSPAAAETHPSSPPPSHSSSPPPSHPSQSQPQIILLMDSNGKFIDENKLFPRKNIKKIWCPNTQKALELLCEEQLGSPSHIIIHTGTNDLRAQRERVATALINVTEKASSNFPNSKIILSTLLLRSDFHPDTIRHINARVSRDCALKPNVHLAQHPTLNLSSLYDHVHLHRRRAVPIFAKTLKDIALNRSSSAPLRPHGHPIEPLQGHPSNHHPLHHFTPDRRHPTTGSVFPPGQHRMTRPAAPSPSHPHEHRQEQQPGSRAAGATLKQPADPRPTPAAAAQPTTSHLHPETSQTSSTC